MSELLNDWKPEIRGLLKRLTDGGCRLVKADNGEYAVDFAKQGITKLIECLDACDEARLYVVDAAGKNRWLYIVLGNSPGEMVSDYSIPEGAGMEEPFDALLDAHYTEWQSRKQPTKPNPYHRV